MSACKPRDNQVITPRPIPPGYDFPGDRNEIQGWADAWNTARITPKAWNLWAGLHADSGEVYPGTGLPMPVWDTWNGEEIFPAPGQPSPDPTRRKATHVFHGPRQFHHPAGGGPVVTPTEQRVSFNKFNPDMAAYLTQGHPLTPGGPPYFYNQFTRLAALNLQWPANTPLAQRAVQQAPYTAPSAGNRGSAAMELKPVLYLVKKSQPTPVPVWRGVEDSVNSGATCTPEQQALDKCHPTPSLWLTCAIVDPTAPADAPIAEATAEQSQRVAPLIAQANSANPQAPVFSCQRYCVSCHGTASVGSAFVNTASSPPAAWAPQTPSYPCDYKAPIDFATYKWLKGFTNTDFSWAIPADPQPLPQNPNNLPLEPALNCP
ncbi:hypothetical protein D7X32_36445 [Corallococcus carmarthensis]|uniref:Uncharacterized protein n=1 Tax=Corallococcus carmarthensis TaxID=2316728 RepID=A0A3A8JVK0_9BACT|nr:hypothetical protein D7X32_36445 [Corallococcus carmarthensis]